MDTLAILIAAHLGLALLAVLALNHGVESRDGFSR
jgi:hypothetical protein